MPETPRMTQRLLMAVALVVVATSRANCESSNSSTDTYSQEIAKRVDKIVTPLKLANDEQNRRVRDLITEQYRVLRELYAARDARLEEVKRSPGDATVAEWFVKLTRDATSLKLADAHRRFVARLAAELAPDQVDVVKDGMTYGVVQVTYKRYLELFPDMREAHKREILADLLEARELAMDGGSSEDKHAVFGKYKGRINNYLSKAGYDMKQAEKDLAEKQKSASPQP